MSIDRSMMGLRKSVILESGKGRGGVEVGAPDPSDGDRDPDHVLQVPGEADGERVDAFLAKAFRDRSRNRFKKLIQEGRVLVNRVAVKPGYVLRGGDLVAVWMDAPPQVQELSPEAMDIEILYEDGDILVLNKPPGLVVHPGAGHREGTLVHGLLSCCDRLASQGAPFRPGIVHRLDQGTSGAMVVAKSDSAYLDLIEQFKAHAVQKDYLALVYGSLPAGDGEIRTSMDRHPVDRKKMAVVTGRGREAVSRWRVERDWGELSLLRVAIETGRTHQIRVHMSHLHHPIVGDTTYGGGPRKAQALRLKPLRDLLVRVQRPMLHSSSLGFLHPSTKTPVLFQAPLPEDFSRLVDAVSRLLPS